MLPVKTGKIPCHKHKKRHMKGIDCQVQKLTALCQLQKMPKNHKEYQYCFYIIKLVKSLCHFVTLSRPARSALCICNIITRKLINSYVSFFSICVCEQIEIFYIRQKLPGILPSLICNIQQTDFLSIDQ